MTAPQQEVVFVIDDDESMRMAVDSLLRSRGRHVETFSSVGEFLDSGRATAKGCLVLDVQIPGMGGLELQDALLAAGYDLPVVFITGFEDVGPVVRAMKSGAVDFLSKPFREVDLLRAVDEAMGRAAQAWDRREGLREPAAHYATLSARERQVFGGVVAGMPNKQIAAQLGVSEKTVKVHRAHAMAKMQARSLPDLVRLADRLSDAGNLHPRELDSSAA